MIELSKYKTIVFDCDGVILNSNKLKTEAFFKAALPYGKSNADKLVAYHLSNGGISRNVKFEIFLSEILGIGADKDMLKKLLLDYANEVKQGLLECEVAMGLTELRRSMPDIFWMVISGGNQKEIRSVFCERGIDAHFDRGIFGSPDDKKKILNREIASGNLIYPALFLGDSKYDYESASSAGLDFIFVSEWSESEKFKKYCINNALITIKKVGDLSKLLIDKNFLY
jgi:phosphoglycolate phosphatase-like HAD superfamily hydrolase